jgi:hypothetical protein
MEERAHRELLQP